MSAAVKIAVLETQRRYDGSCILDMTMVLFDGTYSSIGLFEI